MPEPWPDLPLAAWKPTYDTLHLMTQIVGKLKLAAMPMTNQWWQAALYVSARGLTTGPIPVGHRLYDGEFDFAEHALVIRMSDAPTRRLPLEGTIKQFYAAVLETLEALGIEVRLNPQPQEMPGAIPFDQDDTHGAYDREAVQRWWHILARTDTLLKAFRAGFTGKCSPVHFFWGSFDLTVSRFSGRPAPPRPGADRITRLAYNEEVCSVGFWPGGMGVDGPAFYAYHAPKPPGYESAHIEPAQAYWHDGLQEWILPYDAVRRAPCPDDLVLAFARSTYEAAAKLAHWPRRALERIPAEARPVIFLRDCPTPHTVVLGGETDAEP